jgi:hypothetical protein
LPLRRIYDDQVPLTGEYEPSPRKWVREQVKRYEATNGREANTLPGTKTKRQIPILLAERRP